MDFAIISKESTAYDLQPLVCLWVLIFWKVYFNSLCLITGTHSPICPPLPRLLPPTKHNQHEGALPPTGSWGEKRSRCDAWLQFEEVTCSSWRGHVGKKTAHHRLFGSRMLQALSKAILWAIYCEWVSFAPWMLPPHRCLQGMEQMSPMCFFCLGEGCSSISFDWKLHSLNQLGEDFLTSY